MSRLAGLRHIGHWHGAKREFECGQGRFDAGVEADADDLGALGKRAGGDAFQDEAGGGAIDVTIGTSNTATPESAA